MFGLSTKKKYKNCLSDEQDEQWLSVNFNKEQIISTDT